MPDPKGIYNSPSESGWATVLQKGPNFLGIAQQQQSINARRAALADAAEAKKQAEREKQIMRLAQDMGKPTPTAFPYQETVNQMKNESLSKLQKMFLDNEDMSKVRFEAANMVQDITSYATSAQQVYKGMTDAVNGLGKQYKKDEVIKAAAGKFVGNDGKMIDPRKMDIEDLSMEDMIFSSERPWDFLDENAVIKNFLKADAFKTTSMDIQRKLDTGELGRFYAVGTKTEKTSFAGKAFEVDALSGKAKVSDPDTLIQNGVFQIMLNDREMLAIVDKHVADLTQDRLTPLSDNEKDIVRAGVLHDLLLEQAPGPSTMERINMRYMPKYVGTGGSGKMTNDEKYSISVNQWKQDVSSGEPMKVKEALDYLNVQLGVSDDARTALVEAIDAPKSYEFKDVQLIEPSNMPKSILQARKAVGLEDKNRPEDGGVYAVFENRQGMKQYKPINPDLLGEFGSQIYSTAFRRTGRNYKEELSGATNAAQPTGSSKPFSIFPNKK